MNLIYETPFFKTYQCDSHRCFFFVNGESSIRLTFCQLLAFRTKVMAIDLSSHFDGSNAHGIEILTLCNREHLLILDTHQIIELKDLVKNSFAMLELNALV